MRDEDPGPDQIMLDAYPATRRLANRIAGERGDDLAQDAWLRVWIVRYRYAARDLPKILTVAVQRTWIDWGRAVLRHRETTIPDSWLAGMESDDSGPVPEALTYHLSPEQVVVLADECERLRAAVAGLNPLLRDAVVQHYWMDEPIRGPIAQSRIRRARRELCAVWTGHPIERVSRNTPDAVREAILRDYREHGEPVRVLAARYGVGKSTVQDILKRQWLAAA